MININLVKKIDFFIGMPICFLLTLFYKIFRYNPFSREGNPRLIKKFLIIQLSELGSVILAYPAIKKIQENYPDSEIYFLIFEKNKNIIDILQVASNKNILTIRDDNLILFISDTIRIILRLRREKIDAVLDLELFSRFTAILTYLSGASLKAGFYRYKLEGLYRGELLTHKIPYNPYRHISEQFFIFVDVLNRNITKIPFYCANIKYNNFQLPHIHIDGSEKEKIWNKIKLINSSVDSKNKLILLNYSSGSALPVRSWSLTNFINLARKILEDKNNFVVLIGTKEGMKKAETICNSIRNDRCINLTDNLNLRELIVLFSASSVLITGDSGAAHLASLTNIKSIVIFGPESPILYSPLSSNANIIYKNFICSPCISAFNHRTTACDDNKCMQEITVDRVFEEFMKIKQ